jgi:gliding motility-associated-like protein
MLKVRVLPYPVVNAGNYPVLDMKYYPREVVLDGSGSTKSTDQYTLTYKWTMNPPTNINNSNSIMASFVPEQTKQVAYLTVANEYMGMCPVTDSAAIVIDLGIFIPNVFTPNNDGDHDTWEIQNLNAFYPNVSVDVFSKWGTLVYSSSGYPAAWDGSKNGKEVPAATYYYVIDLKKPGFKPVAGSVTIIR